MRKLRVTSTMRKQLAQLREAGSVRNNPHRGGVMAVPPIMAADDWSAQAALQQDRLLANARDEDSALASVAPAAVVIPEPTSPQEHERHYQDWRKTLNVGQREYLAAKQAEVQRATQVKR